MCAWASCERGGAHLLILKAVPVPSWKVKYMGTDIRYGVPVDLLANKGVMSAYALGAERGG